MNQDQPDLFVSDNKPSSPQSPSPTSPLARRMRPRQLAEVIGQGHLLGDDALLPQLIEKNQFGSLIFYGPPGCGKTSLAEVIIEQTGGHCFRLNASLSNLAEVREVLNWARRRPELRTVLFIDEIHRFNKAQQDALLPDVESGHIRLIGATTRNPGFSIIPALLSRSHLFRLEPLSPDLIRPVLKKALEDCDRGLGAMRCQLQPEVVDGLCVLAGGDLRRALNALETLVLSHPIGSVITLEDFEAYAKERHLRYDRDEDEHYDTISAFIKSIRGGDPDAGLYWLAKMLLGQEDPLFIARRLVILASEDIGMADPRALPLAVATFQACEWVGLPECELNLAHCTVFLATCPKSNRAYLGLQAAKTTIEKEGVQPVPPWLRDKHGSANRQAGNARDYLYSHDFPEGISGQDYMVSPKVFYQPGEHGMEPTVAERLKKWKTLRGSRSPSQAFP